jgi:hypothetical protein
VRVIENATEAAASGTGGDPAGAPLMCEDPRSAGKSQRRICQYLARHITKDGTAVS